MTCGEDFAKRQAEKKEHSKFLQTAFCERRKGWQRNCVLVRIKVEEAGKGER